MIANIVDINAVLMSSKHETLLCSCVWSLKVIKSNETISAHTHSITQTHSKVILLLSCNPINWILHFSFVLQQLDQEFIIKIKINLLSRPSHYHSRIATFTSFLLHFNHGTECTSSTRTKVHTSCCNLSIKTFFIFLYK